MRTVAACAGMMLPPAQGECFGRVPEDFAFYYARQAKVNHNDRPVRPQHAVLGFEIAVDNVLCMDVGHGAGQLQTHADPETGKETKDEGKRHAECVREMQ